MPATECKSSGDSLSNALTLHQSLETECDLATLSKSSDIQTALRIKPLLLQQSEVTPSCQLDADCSERTTDANSSIFLYMMVAVTAVTGFLMGYDLCIVAVVLGPIRDHFAVCASVATVDGLSEAKPCVMNELFVAILAPGAMLSSLLGGWAADRFGRRAILITSDVFFTLAATLMSISNTYTGMLLGRALLGIGIGMGFVVFPTYMAEVAPANIRGALVTCQEVAQCIGCLAAYAITCLVNPSTHWRVLLFAAGVPAILQLFGTLLLPESPRWLVTNRQMHQACTALERIAGERSYCSKGSLKSPSITHQFVDQLLASPSAMSGSDLSRLSRVRATRILLEDFEDCGRRLSDITNLDFELRTLASRSASRTSLQLDETDVPAASSSVSKKRQPPLRVLLELMEEQELREENRQKRREERIRRNQEEMTAAADEGRLSNWRRAAWNLKILFSLNNLQCTRRLLARKGALFVAIGCAASQNLTGANTILYYSVDLMRSGGICDPLFTGVMIGVLKLLGVLTMLYYLERIGRRIPLIFGTLGTIWCHIGLAVLFRTMSFEQCPAYGLESSQSAIPRQPASLAVMGLLWGLMFFWNISWAGLMFVIASEVLPSNIRGTGMGIVIASFWVLAFIFQLVFRLLVLAITATGTFALLAVTSTFVLLFAIYFVPDCTGKTLEEITQG